MPPVATAAVYTVEVCHDFPWEEMSVALSDKSDHPVFGYPDIKYKCLNNISNFTSIPNGFAFKMQILPG